MTAPRAFFASVNRISPFWRALGLGVTLAACGATSSNDALGGATLAASDAQIAGEQDNTTAKDVKSDTTGGGGGGVYWADASMSADTASDAQGGGTPTPGTGSGDQGIGLKPGGAQDIAYFRLLLQSGKQPIWRSERTHIIQVRPLA